MIRIISVDIITQHRFATCYLYRITCYWFFGFKCLHHCSYLFMVWFVEICSLQAFLHVEEAIPACEIASIGNIILAKPGMRKVICAKSAIIRARTFVYHNIGCMSPFAIHPICTKLLVHLIRSKV